MSKILVTGCAGFIASETAHQLLQRGDEVIGIDNLNDYYPVVLKEHRLDALKKLKNFTFYKGDIEDTQFLSSVFSKHNFKSVLNLAARAGVRYSMEHPEVYMTTNAMGTLNLLQEMKKYQIEKMVLASTSSLYAGQAMPFSESLPVNTPISPYAASKKAAEVMSYSYHYLYGMDISVVRYFTVYGPAGRPDMSIFRFIKWIDEGTPIELFGDGNQSRDFTYVEDIARGSILASDKKLGYEIINLGGGKEPVTLNQVILEIEKLLGKKAKINYKPFHKADLTETQANIEKAKRILNWVPQIDLSMGLQKSVEWYQKNIDLCKKIKL